jgi:hypothetical protein
MAAFALNSATRVREASTLRATAFEVRELVRAAAEDAARRDQRAAVQQDRLATLTKWLVMLAGLTLAAALVTLEARRRRSEGYHVIPTQQARRALVTSEVNAWALSSLAVEFPELRIPRSS